MPRKIEYYRSYGDKLISIFVRLLFEDRYYSLNELVSFLGCSKPTVLRLLEDIRRSYRVEIEEEIRKREKYIRMKRPLHQPQIAPLTESEWDVLQMCKTFTQHLLGAKLFEEATQALFKSSALVNDRGNVSSAHFACFRPGTIDYTPYHNIIHTLINAMNRKKVCKTTYQGIMEDKPKTFYIKPIKLFSHKDSIYLHAQRARTPGTKYKKPEFDPLLVIHRFKSAEITDINFTPPEKYDSEKIYNVNFGVIKEDVFEVTVEFTGWSAQYVSERVWSPDQKIKKIGKNKIHLTFTAASETEVISWVLFFGEEAKVIAPKTIVKHISSKAELIKGLYTTMS